jgi:hypothetical protein
MCPWGTKGSLAKKALIKKGLDQHIGIQHTFLILNIVVWFFGKFFAVEDWSHMGCATHSKLVCAERKVWQINTTFTSMPWHWHKYRNMHFSRTLFNTRPTTYCLPFGRSWLTDSSLCTHFSHCVSYVLHINVIIRNCNLLLECLTARNPPQNIWWCAWALSWV